MVSCVTMPSGAPPAPDGEQAASAEASAQLDRLSRPMNIAASVCPRCRAELDGGPVLFHCSTCGRAVYAADLDLETSARPLVPVVTA
ncbi:hypothetical protein [Streptosporangium sp. NPDC051022]|uniref:hypothetical protein n=1 Tax=Streptosporangium sp. NPDC051022 TaxID=3155752 RepID=UPI0034142C7E